MRWRVPHTDTVCNRALQTVVFEANQQKGITMALGPIRTEIRNEARYVLRNPRLLYKDILAWQTSEIPAECLEDDEISVLLRALSIWIIVNTEVDKR